MLCNNNGFIKNLYGTPSKILWRYYGYYLSDIVSLSELIGNYFFGLRGNYYKDVYFRGRDRKSAVFKVDSETGTIETVQSTEYLTLTRTV
jgi:hypothetical protein